MDKKVGIPVFAAISLAGLALCQWSSYFVNLKLSLGQSYKVFSFLYFTHVRNMGGIFGILQGKGWLFGLISFVFVGTLVAFVLFGHRLKAIEYVLYGMIVAGGSSNILDRLIYGSVVDFIDIRGLPAWKYIFNSADMMIHLGVWPLLLISFFLDKHRAEQQDTVANS